MFHNIVPTTVNWTSCTEPKTLVNVGSDAIAVCCQNIITFYDIKTNAKTYYKADNPVLGCGISNLAGHNRFPLFAISEALLRPAIHVIKYPEMEKLVSLTTDDITTYIDLRFSEFSFLIALGGYPEYILRIWNYRSGVLYADIATGYRCSQYSLLCSNNAMPHLMQCSFWHKQILVWELCHTAEKHYLYEISTINIPDECIESKDFCITYGEDGSGFLVDDYGTVHLIEVVRAQLKRLWSPYDNSLENEDAGEIPRQDFSIFSNKLGMLVTNSKQIWFIKQRTTEWYTEWMLDKLPGNFVKIISTFNNEIFAATELGNIYRIEAAQESAQITGISITNCLVNEYAFLKGIKEEVVLLLTTLGELRILDLTRHNIISTLHIPNAKFLATHNVLPLAAVTAEDGVVHFVSYEKVRFPYVVGDLKVDAKVTHVCMMDKCAFIQDNSDRFHIALLNDKKSKYEVLRCLESERECGRHVSKYFMLDELRSIVFGNSQGVDLDAHLALADAVWIYEWHIEIPSVRCTEFLFPYQYRDFLVYFPATSESTEFFCVRYRDFIVDAYVLLKNRELNLLFSIKTAHFSHINGIAGSKNILTWGVQSMLLHFRTHRKAKGQYVVRRVVLTTFVPRVKRRVDECYNLRYLLVLLSEGTLVVYRLPILSDNLKENVTLTDAATNISPNFEADVRLSVKIVEREVTERDLERRDYIVEELRKLSSAMKQLIDYDIAVTGREHGIYRKFCLNHTWLNLLTNQARILCEKERVSLLEAIADQCRIRDWILELIGSKNTRYCIKMRSIFSNIYVDNYSIYSPIKMLFEHFDKFRFYEMEPFEDEEEAIEERKGHELDDDLLGEEEEEGAVEVKRRKRFHIMAGESVFDHIMAKEFDMQDINLVTGHQLYNEDAKFKMILGDALMEEFNKKFVEIRNLKQEIMDNVIGTNTSLQRIYSNMNCMLCLLGMQQFIPPVQSVPEWFRDEVIERILTVDDAEIKAINRRKKQAVVEAKKSGRMLLWTVEFWVRALMIMMDGVLEKLWEEEIKKTPPLPEFMLKKMEHEYSLEDQKLFRLYEETLRILDQDRRKYLKMLGDSETKTLDQKRRHIMRLNECIAELSILKFKYDFAIRHGHLRLQNLKVTHLKRIQLKRTIQALRGRIEKINIYIERYGHLSEFWETNLSDFKVRQDQATGRDKAMDKQFKSQFLPTVPAHLTYELNKIFKRRPKLSSKIFNSALVCYDVADRIVSRKAQKFPLPLELLEQMKIIDSLDDPQNCPNQLDAKIWEQFIKMRRQKLEGELRVKGIGFQLMDAQTAMNGFEKDLEVLKTTRNEVSTQFLGTLADFFDVSQDQYLQVTLTMGQIEVGLRGNMENLASCILMHVDDVNGVNELIKQAGTLKLKAMQRVAFFRRKVIYKEWEHRVVRANIEYFKYILHLVEKCKVTYEFLEVLRNWNKLKENREAASRFGLIENAIERKITSYRKNLDRILKEIDDTKQLIEEVRTNNQRINKDIDNLKVSVTFLSLNRDTMNEQKIVRERRDRMSKIKQHRFLLDEVRRDYVHILELTTILELQRLRTYPTLGPAPQQCFFD